MYGLCSQIILEMKERLVTEVNEQERSLLTTLCYFQNIFSSEKTV